MKENGTKHLNYRVYTSMERALNVLLTGNLYISNGKNWNDREDSDIMRQRKLFGTCFSCSTRENIAMWMLYGDKSGKNGAMLKFTQSAIKEIMNLERISLGYFNDNGKYVESYILCRKNDDFRVFFTDMIYIDPCKNDKVKISYDKNIVTVDNSVLITNDIFYKNIAWEYEKECRLIIKLSKKCYENAENENLSIIKICLSNKTINKMKKNGLVRSPTYSGSAEYGLLSSLTGKVIWNI